MSFDRINDERIMVDSVVWEPIQKAIESVGLTLNDILEDNKINRHFFELCFAVAHRIIEKESHSSNKGE